MSPDPSLLRSSPVLSDPLYLCPGSVVFRVNDVDKNGGLFQVLQDAIDKTVLKATKFCTVSGSAPEPTTFTEPTVL